MFNGATKAQSHKVFLRLGVFVVLTYVKFSHMEARRH